MSHNTPQDVSAPTTAQPITRIEQLLSTEQIGRVNASYTDNAIRMMKKRYLQPREDGTQETPAEMMFRIARATAEVELGYGASVEQVNDHLRSFFEVMARKEFTPAGRTVTNAGARTAVVANCIVLKVEDTMDSIFQTLKEAALLQQAGSGIGFDFSFLRPAMSLTKRTQGEASGPIEFLKIYDTAFGIIKQQKRHGANMAMMSIHHPDVIDFIRVKEVEGDVRNFNISVQLTDAFMEAVLNHPDEQWMCDWKGKKMKPQKVLRAPNGSVIGAESIDITTRELFDMIVDCAWQNGEPGIFFIDEVNRVSNPLPGLGAITCTNPCGEQPLHPNDNCNLGSINLAAFVKDGTVEWDRLAEVTKRAVRIQDNVIDLFDFPVESITELAQKNRRIGLGVMGWADMLYQLGVPYDSAEGVALAERVMETVNTAAHHMSQELAGEKGEFPNIHLSVYGEEYGGEKVPMRNAALTTIAPTGSISMMYDCSSGIEPNFALTYIKQDKDAVKYHYFNRHFKKALDALNFSAERMEEIKQELLEKGSIKDINGIPDELKRVYVVSMDIMPEDHMKMQAAFQKYTDNSISKTINYPNSATREDVARGYISAWKLGCLSCTVYRDGSREVQILNVGKEDKVKSILSLGKKGVVEEEAAADGEGKDTAEHTEEPRSTDAHSATNGIKAKKRPSVMAGKTYRMKTGYGSLFITINDDDAGRPFEVFAAIGKTGGYMQEQSEGMCRMISISLRAGVSVSEIIDQLKGIRGPQPAFTEHGTIYSLPDAIARVLEIHIRDTEEPAPQSQSHGKLSAEEGADPHTEPALVATQEALIPEGKSIADMGHSPMCPECGEMLQMAEGCVSCRLCGFSRCS